MNEPLQFDKLVQGRWQRYLLKPKIDKEKKLADKEWDTIPERIMVWTTSQQLLTDLMILVGLMILMK